MKRIAIFTDIHALLEPLDAILKDIKNKGITDIYSLGDVVGLGPNPKEVLGLLKKYNVKNIMGNTEEYVLLGGKAFDYFEHKNKYRYQKWTDSKLDDKDREYISSFKHSYILELGGKRIGLCHFANDVRIDYKKYSTWSYQDSLKKNDNSAIKQFYNANSKEQLDIIKEKYNTGKEEDLGYKSCYEDPIFDGHTIDYFDQIFQGHVHFASEVKDDNVIITTLRAVAMAFGDKDNDKAYYIILNEEENGYSIEECYVKYDRDSMINTILNCDFTSKLDILKYVDGPKMYYKVMNGNDVDNYGVINNIDTNIYTVDKVYDYLVDGNYIYEVIVPEDANFICVDEGVYKTDKVIYYNRWIIDEEEKKYFNKMKNKK